MQQPAFPGPEPEDDFDLDADLDRWVADIDAGRRRIPEEWELAGSAVSVSLGDASDVDPALLAAMCGPDGLGGQAPSAAFGQDRAADVLRPGPVLCALTEQAVSDLPSLSDEQLIGVLSAARRLENRKPPTWPPGSRGPWRAWRAAPSTRSARPSSGATPGR